MKMIQYLKLVFWKENTIVLTRGSLSLLNKHVIIFLYE